MEAETDEEVDNVMGVESSVIRFAHWMESTGSAPIDDEWHVRVARDVGVQAEWLVLHWNMWGIALGDRKITWCGE
jgi:hypothetical protein